jgi:uncharacterized protein
VKAAVSYRHPWRTDALGDGGPDVLEVVADHFFARPALLERLADRYPILVHDVGCSVGSGGPEPQRLARLAEVVRRSRAIGFSDHLAVTRSSTGVDLGHLCPLWYRHDVLRVVTDGVRRLQDTLGIPVALENISTPFDVPLGELSEGEFWHRLVDSTGCGVLLDVTNVLLDARNAGADPLDRLRALPLHAARWAHVAGGRSDGAFWVDSHSAPVEAATLALLVRVDAPLEGVIVERDAHLPPWTEMVAEARLAAGVRR